MTRAAFHLGTQLSIAATAAAVAGVAALMTVMMFLSGKAIAVAVLGGIVLTFFLVLSGNPRLFCLWGLILTAPLELGKKFMATPHMGGAGAYAIELVDLFILAMLVFLARDFFMGYRKQVRLSAVTFFWGGMIALGMLTMIFGPFRHVAGHEVFRMIKCLVLFLIIVNEVVRTKQFLHVFAALTVGIGIQVLIALAEFAFQSTLGLQVLGEASKESIELTAQATYRSGMDAPFRVGALLGHSNLLAGYIALLVPICIAVLFAPVKFSYRLAAGSVAAGAAVVQVLTLSRTGWVDFGVSFMALLALSFLHPRMRRRMVLGRLAMIVMVGVLALAFSGPIIKRFTESDPGALDFRYEFMGVSWRMIKEKPVLGFGLNSFVFHMGPYTKYGTPSKLNERFGENWPVVHNIYLLTWTEQGTIGLLLFLGLLFYVFRTGLRNTRHLNNELLYAINIGCLAGFFAMSVDGLASFFMRNAGPGRMFWIVVALMVAISYWYRDNAPRRPQSRTKAGGSDAVQAEGANP